MKIVIVTGGFDPLHSGHIAYLQAARKLGDQLVVGLNSDDWLARKKGRPFMPYAERYSVLAELACVDRVLDFDDRDGSAKDLIKRMLETLTHDDEIVFANGGDRTDKNIPEMDLEDARLTFAFGVGGFNKANSSSWILEDWKKPKTDRTWGYYRVLHEVGNHVKLKELTVNPKTCLSMQRHEKRAEFWFVAEGEATVYTVDPHSTEYDLMASPAKHQATWIKLNEWHQLCNETDQPLKLIEIQYGENCVEEDIERK
jgi:D-beta-D-heptose 7-phosphate kinase/D-beta-D-heptose 1-phosphate adenosyltransferase